MKPIALGISHTPWIPERVESLARLLGTLGLYGQQDPRYTRIFGERAANHEWSEAMWSWAADAPTEHALFLQDDVVAAPLEVFWPELRGMLAAVPDQVICLEVVHPAARAVKNEWHTWMTTADLMVGVGYALPTALLREFLAWRAELLPGAVEAIPEDTLLGLWCACVGRRVYHPLPTIIDHDTALQSTYQNDQHSHRRPLVRWNTEEMMPDTWVPASPPHLGRFWDLSGLADKWVKPEHRPALDAYRADDGTRPARKFATLERARRIEDEPRARILVCVPNRGDVSTDTVSSLLQLATLIELEVETALDLERVRFETDSVVHARARFIRTFLESDATHLLFVDADVSFDARAVYGMLASGHDFVQTPYPKRGDIDWKAVGATDDERPIEARGHRYAMRVPPVGFHLDEHICSEIYGTGLGLTLLSRKCLKSMCDYYRGTLETVDDGRPIVMLTSLLLATDPSGKRVLLSEDYSLCERWRQMGGRVMLYLGDGSPATHHGEYAFRGRIESLGLRRIEEG